MKTNSFKRPTTDEINILLAEIQRQNKQAQMIETALDYGGMLFAFMLMAFVARLLLC